MRWLSTRFELYRGGDADNVRAVEGLRGLAVFLVFLVHYVTLITPLMDPTLPAFRRIAAIGTIGNAGVDLFFVISGYLIHGALIARERPYGAFILRRIRRLYPAYSVVFGVYLILSWIYPAESKIPPGATDGALYLAKNFFLLAGFDRVLPMIAVTWSLTYEMAFYLAIPLVISGWRLRERSIDWRIGFFLVILATSGLLLAFFGGPIRMTMFIAGILLHEVMARHRLHAPGGVVGFAALAAGLAGMLLPVPGPVRTGILFCGLFVLCLSCIAHPRDNLARAFSWTPVRWLGNMSYSFYLIHGLALKACFHLMQPLLAPGHHGMLFFCAMVLPIFAVILAPAVLLYLLVERPFSLSKIVSWSSNY